MACSAGDSGVVVKNTFLEVGDHKSLLEKHGDWRRQMSEPVKIYTNMGGEEEVEVCDIVHEEEEIARGRSLSELAAAVSNQQDVLMGEPASSASTGSAANNKPPKVLLLAESLPTQQQKGRGGASGGGGGGGGERNDRDRNLREGRTSKDSQINAMKNNDITKKEPPWTDVTTVMMRNLPNKYTQQMLLEELQDGGFRLQKDFDFFYLPMDHSNAANLGYCFINFVETTMANAFAAAFQGKKMRRFNSNKTVVVMPASIQGFDRNYAYYASTRVAQAEDPAYRPLFLRPTSTPQASNNSSTSPAMGSRGGGQSGGQSGGKNRSGPAANEVGGRGTNRKGRDKGGKGDGKAEGAAASANNAGLASLPPMDAGSLGMYGANLGGAADWNPGVLAGWPPQATPPQPQAQPAAPLTGTCRFCNHECSNAHRFCAFCGSFIGGDTAPSAVTQQQQQQQQQNSYMRADAPTFMPHVAPGMGREPPMSQPPPPPQRNSGPANLAAETAGVRLPGGPLAGYQYPELVTDELDVMRGRMMLLAALKDMEKRGTGGARDDDGVNDMLGMPGGAAQLPW